MSVYAAAIWPRRNVDAASAGDRLKPISVTAFPSKRHRPKGQSRPPVGADGFDEIGPGVWTANGLSGSVGTVDIAFDMEVQGMTHPAPTSGVQPRAVGTEPTSSQRALGRLADTVDRNVF